MSYIFSAPPVTSVEISGSEDRFPVHRVYCIGRNYFTNADEASKHERQAPYFFQKPADGLVPSGGEFPYPSVSENVQHEIELVVAIGKGGANIAVVDALDHVFGYAVGFEMTRRDLQDQAKAAGTPWDAAKGFDHSAPISAIRPTNDIGHPASGRIWLAVNGTLRQDSDLSLQIWNVQETIAHLSSLFTLIPGDILYMGTPAGAGPVKPGDVITGGIDEVGELEIKVV
jgi:fumarylpyruvate hydrolase